MCAVAPLARGRPASRVRQGFANRYRNAFITAVGYFKLLPLKHVVIGDDRRIFMFNALMILIKRVCD